MLIQEDFEKEFLKYYNQGMSTTKICNILNEKRDRGYNFLRKNNLSSHKEFSRLISLEDENKIKDLYLKGHTIEEISQILNIKAGTVNYRLKKLKITRLNGKVADCNENYFQEIDTPNKAYFLGLLYADGGFTKHKRKNGNYNLTLTLELKKEDKYIIEEFRKQIQSSLPIKENKRKMASFVNNKEYHFIKDNFYFRISCKKMIEDLISLGCVENKTHDLKGIPDIKNEFKKYFLLGFYDGDGIASVGKTGYMGFCGTEAMMENISSFLEIELKIKHKKVYFNKFNHIYYLQYTTKEEIKKIFEYFYNDTNIPYLIRKKNKIENYLKVNTEVI